MAEVSELDADLARALQGTADEPEVAGDLDLAFLPSLYPDSVGAHQHSTAEGNNEVVAAQPRPYMPTVQPPAPRVEDAEVDVAELMSLLGT